jgi:hypothetical protein
MELTPIRVWSAIFAVAVLGVSGALYGLVFRDGRQQKIVEITEKAKELAVAQTKNRESTTPEQRREQWKELQEQAKDLDFDEHLKVWEGLVPVMKPMFMQRLDEFLAKTPAEQIAELDKQIDRAERARAERERRRAEAAAKPPEERTSSSAPAGESSAEPKKPKVDFRNLTDEQKLKLQKKIIQWTTDEERAKINKVTNMMEERRKERGLPPLPMPRLF